MIPLRQFRSPLLIENMLQYLFGILSPALLLPQFLHWAKGRIDLQIEKMQEASFSTPGTEAPIPPEVVLGGMAFAAGHIVLGRVILRMRFIHIVLSLLLGSLLGIALFVANRTAK